MRYRHKPTEVDAMRFTGANSSDLANWLAAELGEGQYHISGGGHLLIETLEGDRDCPYGYWVVKGIHGEFYPVDPDVFADAYEPADPDHVMPVRGEDVRPS